MNRMASLIITGALAAAGCAVTEYPVATTTPAATVVATNPYPPVPAARVEVVPSAPSATVVWEPGHWRWNGATYEWLPGSYVERTVVTGTRWVEPHWEGRGGSWVWVDGHWA